MGSLHISHEAESRLLSVFSLSTQLLALVYIKLHAYPKGYCQHNCYPLYSKSAHSSFPSWLSFMSVKLTLELAGCQVVCYSPHAPHGHRVKLQHQKHTGRHTIHTYIREILPFNSLMWGEHEQGLISSTI